MQHRISH